MENWILSIPAPSAPNKTVYEDFEGKFIESWTDTHEPYRAATKLDKLRAQHDNINKYIIKFAELAHKALYHEDDPAVLEKFKSGLPLELLEPCIHHPLSLWRSTRCTRFLHDANPRAQKTMKDAKDFVTFARDTGISNVAALRRPLNNPHE